MSNNKYYNEYIIGLRSKYLNAFSVIVFSSFLYAQFQPQNTSQLRVAVDLWVENDSLAMITYGDISTWDVSGITSFSQLFQDKSTFNGDISTWDVSNVTNMYYAFCNASSFNQDLSNWDVSSVTSMHMMFPGCTSFTSDLSGWDVSNV